MFRQVVPRFTKTLWSQSGSTSQKQPLLVRLLSSSISNPSHKNHLRTILSLRCCLLNFNVKATTPLRLLSSEMGNSQQDVLQEGQEISGKEAQREAERQSNIRKQSDRLSTLQIRGLPAELRGEELEDEVKHLILRVGGRIDGLETIYRSSISNQVDVKYKEKQYAFKTLKLAKAHLQDIKPGVYMSPYMIKEYLEIWFYARQLHREQKIHNYYFLKGMVHVGVDSSEYRGKAITHMDDYADLGLLTDWEGWNYDTNSGSW